MRFPVAVAAGFWMAASLAGAEVSGLAGHVFAPVVTLMNTNTRGIYPLPKAWVGKENVSYSDAAPGNAPENRQMRLDAAQVHGDFRHTMEFCRWVIGARDGDKLVPGKIFGYCERLPSDAELASLRDDAAVTSVFGWRLLSTNLHGAAGIGADVSCFTLGTNNTLETLRVAFYKDRPGTNIQSVTVQRATLRREGVWWYP